MTYYDRNATTIVRVVGDNLDKIDIFTGYNSLIDLSEDFELFYGEYYECGGASLDKSVPYPHLSSINAVYNVDTLFIWSLSGNDDKRIVGDPLEHHPLSEIYWDKGKWWAKQHAKLIKKSVAPDARFFYNISRISVHTKEGTK